MSEPRPVRIARTSGSPPAKTSEARDRSAAGPAPVDFRPNRAGTQRAYRISLVYLVILIALYLAFALSSRDSPGGTGAAATTNLGLFTLAAAVLAVGGVAFTFTPVPRGILREADGFVLVGRWGNRSEWRPLSQVTIHRVRHYPAGFLASAPVDSVELTREGRGRRSYFLETGLLPDRGTDADRR